MSPAKKTRTGSTSTGAWSDCRRSEKAHYGRRERGAAQVDMKTKMARAVARSVGWTTLWIIALTLPM